MLSPMWSALARRRRKLFVPDTQSQSTTGEPGDGWTPKPDVPLPSKYSLPQHVTVDPWRTQVPRLPVATSSTPVNMGTVCGPSSGVVMFPSPKSAILIREGSRRARKRAFLS